MKSEHRELLRSAIVLGLQEQLPAWLDSQVHWQGAPIGYAGAGGRIELQELSEVVESESTDYPGGAQRDHSTVLRSVVQCTIYGLLKNSDVQEQALRLRSALNTVKTQDLLGSEVQLTKLPRGFLTHTTFRDGRSELYSTTELTVKTWVNFGAVAVESPVTIDKVSVHLRVEDLPEIDLEIEDPS